ncbi:MAG: methyltransferase domain-containing protein [Balneolaceae bacterium]
MPLILSKRNTGLTEIMDDPDCNRDGLFRTYRTFDRMNRMLSGWKSVYKNEIRPVMDHSSTQITLLDIGSGGGDVPGHLSELARKDGFSIQITAIDPDERAIEFAKRTNSTGNINFECTRSDELVKEGRQFDFVISNHLIHHLDDSEILNLCRDAEKLCRYRVLFNDIERGDLGYAFFSLVSPLLFRNTFIPTDGPLSIRRSFTKSELQELLPAGWMVNRLFPYRLIAMYNAER